MRFIDLLREIFELDKSNLDFGLYRILNIRKNEIDRFLSVELPTIITNAITEIVPNCSVELSRIKEIEASCKSHNISIEDCDEYPEFQTLQEKIRQSSYYESCESNIYSLLYTFFSRYYDEGDFISKRRFREGIYSMPYEGEEIKFYWANQDQYFIKSSEDLKNFSYRLNDRTVHFVLSGAILESNNKKSKSPLVYRLFVPNEYSDYETFEVSDKDMIIRFEYIYLPEDSKKKDFDDETCSQIIKTIKDTYPDWRELLKNTSDDPKKPILLIEKLFKTYIAKNTFDYFIHKDLKSFLMRELDNFLKTEVMFIDSLGTKEELPIQSYLTEVRVIKKIGQIIIEFLASMEEFQKKIWLKKKYVLSSNWCICIGLIDSKLYPQIVCNKQQISEWVELFSINTFKKTLDSPGFTDPLSVEFLKANPHLVLDTKYFTEEFKEELLCTFDNLSDLQDGLLIHGENFQALNLLKATYNSSIKCTYIDPPFNLGENPDYAYKVDYKDSTWLNLIGDRLELLYDELSDDAALFVRCSHDGNMLLRLLLDTLYGKENYRNEIILRRAEETKGDLNKQFETLRSITVNYDNLYWYSKNKNARYGKILKPIKSEKSDAHWHSFWKAENRPNMRYDILGIDLSDRNSGQWMWSKERAYCAVDNYKAFIEEQKQTDITLEDYWIQTGRKLEFIKRDGDKISSIKYWIPPRTEIMADTNWLDIKGYSNNWGFRTENSEELLKRIIQSLTVEGETCMDFFLGSGTTAAVAHKLRRKWIGVEMGDHFYTVILPRMKMVLFGEQSGISKDVKWSGGGAFRYISLENYEDALSNVVLSNRQRTLFEMFGTEAFVKYSFDNDMSSINSSLLSPFSSKLNVIQDNDLKTVQINYSETFDLLLGIKIKQYLPSVYLDQDYKPVPSKESIYRIASHNGIIPSGEKVLVIWRNVPASGLDLANRALEKASAHLNLDDYDIIFVNGDTPLSNITKARVLDSTIYFKHAMFNEGADL